MESLDQVELNFNSTSLLIINIVLAFIMFGIALDLNIESFKKVLKQPKALGVGLFSQIIGLPFLTYLLVLIMQPEPSLALGMILIAACPGGNISNFFSALAKANVELSIVMTSVTSVLAIVFTPFNFAFYGNKYEPAATIMQSLSLDWANVAQTIALIIIIPIILGLLTRRYFPEWAKRLVKPLRYISMLLFVLIVIGALFSNLDFFFTYVGMIFFLVLVHNFIALSSGYLWGVLFKCDIREKKSLSIETGIQNSGLGLLLIFGFFSGLGGMAIIAAWWGIWHIVMGFVMAGFFSRVD